MFKNPFSFNGRIRRLEYGTSFIIYFFAYATLIASIPTLKLMIFIALLPLLWFIWAQGAKRCHDIGKSGWWQIIPFYFLVLIFETGDPLGNKYGQNPKDPLAENRNYPSMNRETLDAHLKDQ